MFILLSIVFCWFLSDKKQCPLKYEDCEKIVVARQVVIGGRNRYIINGE